MLVHLCLALFAATRTILRSTFNIMLFSLLSRIFRQWFGLNGTITFFCSAYCLSKITGYIQRIWLNARLRAKKSHEKILAEDLTWETSTTIDRRNENGESIDCFDTDWQTLLDNDSKNIFSSVVNVPFNNAWVTLGTMMTIEYLTKNLGYSYIPALVRTIGCVSILVCGSAIRYQTLYERDRNTFLELMIKERDDIERYIVYSRDVPVASICLQWLNRTSNEPTLMVQLYQIDARFNDYLNIISDYICQRLIECTQIYAEQSKKKIRLVWSLPTCRQDWIWALKNNKFALCYTYTDFAFMPFVNSTVTQYDLIYNYNQSLPIREDHLPATQ